MKPLLMMIGLVFGALVGGYLAANFGGDYVNQLSFESPDEQSNLYNLVFLGGAGVVGLFGLLLGYVVAALLSRKTN